MDENKIMEEENSEAQIISVHEFLDFLNLSCRLNDMINNGRANLINNNNNNTSSTGTQQTSVVSGGVSRNRKNCAFLNNVTIQQQQQQKERYTINVTTTNTIATNTARGGAQFEIDFKKLADNSLVNNLYGFTKNKQQQNVAEEINNASECQNSKDNKINVILANGLHPLLNDKLDYVINEGILDAVLPFICPVVFPAVAVANTIARANKTKHVNNNNNNNNNNNCQTILGTVATKENRLSLAVNCNSFDSTTIPTEISSNAEIAAGVCTKLSFIANSSGRRKSVGNTKSTLSLIPKDSEVVIHVVDEVKNTAKDFTCAQSLLIQKMGYFADVTAGQKLDDMDISVHCDINIFDWLMRWIKHTASLESGTNSTHETTPQLDASNVVPILVSSSFLQMEPLLLNCLSYCHAHLNDVVRISSNLSCFNDAIITSLAAMFTNLELEAVRDKRERVTPRLWTKLITSLCEPEPEALRGHFYSIAGLFRCNKCGKCLTNAMKSHISCVPHNLRLNRWGQLESHHVRDPHWDINVYIAQLFRELKSWRRVYWKLWGHCHYLYCCVCETHFPVNQITWCRYHPENAIYLGAQGEGRLSGPTGRYPCCSQQAFRYDPMPTPNVKDVKRKKQKIFNLF